MPQTSNKYSPIIIIGAPRSGTNMLRDVLCHLNGFSTWPCDEINYIWRHGNLSYPSDQIPIERATPYIRSYIRKKFDWVVSHYRSHTVVEKTCANSLRVPFVDYVMPEAKFVFIYRDGLDVVGSAMIRWTAGLDLQYLTRKARFVPMTDLPYYASGFIINRLYQLFSREKRLAFWGPKFEGFQEALESGSLEDVCALQWKRCVDLSEEAFRDIEPTRISRVSYEEFVTNPARELKRIIVRLGLEADEAQIESATAGVSGLSVGKGRRALSPKTAAKISCDIGDSLQRYGYE